MSESRFGTLADDVPVMLWVTEADGSCSFLNRRWYEFTGQTPASGLGFGWLEAVHPDDRAMTDAAFKRANDRRERFSLEYRLRQHDGRYCWVIDSAASRFGPGGAFLGSIGSVLEIDERRRMEDALRQSESRHRRIFDAMGVAILDADLSAVREMLDALRSAGIRDIRRHLESRPEIILQAVALVRFNALNPAARSMFRVEGDTGIMPTLDRILLPESMPVLVEELSAVFEGRSELRSEVPLRTLAGEQIEVAFSVAFSRDDPSQRSVLISLVDITDRKRAEEEREWLLVRERAARASADLERARLERLQAATAALANVTSPDAVARVILGEGMAASGATAGLVHVLSEDRKQLELIGVRGLTRLVADEWSVVPITADVGIADATRGRTPIWLSDLEARAERYPHLVRSPATQAFGAWCMLPMLVDGEAIGCLAFAFPAPHTFDAGDRALLETFAAQAAQALERTRLYEAERRARIAAEAANRAKGDFLAMMSHELRTPLNAITGYVELLETEVRGSINEEQRADLERIGHAGRHLLGLLNGLLDHAKLEAGTVRFHIETIAVRELIAAVEPLVMPQLRAKGLSYSCDLADTLPVRADREKVVQILINLLGNAVKFTERGGISVTAEERDTRVLIAVRDTGRGIAPEQLESIFEPFVQVEPRPVRSAGGVGLGLSISRNLARRMAGDIVVTSTVGAGSTFTLLLPSEHRLPER